MVVRTVAVVPERGAEQREHSLADFLPPYRVVLHNDDVNEMAHVVRALLDSVPELTAERAHEVMIEAHERGSADVIQCPYERAELYRDRLESFGLTATIERA
jgi:ATP-dependent Clp protease adaptor protein ClpS